jgi:hypothetical protein
MNAFDQMRKEIPGEEEEEEEESEEEKSHLPETHVEKP